MKSLLFGFFLIVVLAVVLAPGLLAQAHFQNLSWRMIGPHRGGRTVGATGVPGQPNVFYIGVNNGGVWKSTDYGRTWHPIFDDQPTGSIGDIAVAPSDPQVLYVGTGEGLQRPDLAVGDGMFKSSDGGKTFRQIGLDDAQQIAGIAVHPADADTLLVAVLGHPYGPNQQRGVFKSTDGGSSWRKVLYLDADTGAAQVTYQPGNPQIVFADLWAGREGPWENGAWQGPGSGLYKSVDGGETWARVTRGLPTFEQGLGRIGFAFAPSQSERMYATVQAREGGGIYRSDDLGENWTLLSTDRRLWGRGNDFAELKVHPRDPDTLYVGNIAAYVSTDGGHTYRSFKGAPGGDDYHRIWINPENPDIMLMAADQGATITVNGGETWSSWYNQPTAQLYHVSTDNQFPYNVYGGQQESGAISIASRGPGGQITLREWHSVGADEYAYVAPDPLDSNIVYGGRVMRFDRRTGQAQNVAPEALRSGKYRILRTMPLLFSPADPTTLFFATNVLFKTTSGGRQWEIISPDLSRQRPEVPASIGVYRTPQMEEMARRGVIYALGPSPLDEQLIWAGTDDGLVHLTTDGGRQWSDVTPPQLTSWSKISQIDAGHFARDTAYVAVNRIRLDDMRPWIYKTHDGGENWTVIVEGLPSSGPVNVVREDPVQPGLLFAGTEREVYVSFDDGEQWTSLRLNMPASSIRDLVVEGDDLVVGTHGRSIWILDNISPLRQWSRQVERSENYLFAPQTAYRVRWNLFSDTPWPPEEPGGQNPPDGAIIDYWLQSPARQVTLEIFDESGELIRRFSSDDEPEQLDPDLLPYPTYWFRPPQILQRGSGHQRFVWDLHYPPPEGVERSHPISANYRNTASGPLGPWTLPGTYRVRLNVDGRSSDQPLQVAIDPRVQASRADLEQQFELSMRTYRNYQRAYQARLDLESLRAEIAARTDLPEGLRQPSVELSQAARTLIGEGKPDHPDVLYSAAYAAPPGEETFSGLQSKLLHVMALLEGADARPTQAMSDAVEVLQETLDNHLGRYRSLLSGPLQEINRQLRAAGFAPVRP